jgi:beta-galactosidase/beta-glucuronidase
VNPARWYYHADTLGLLVIQDAVQHFGDGSDPTSSMPSPDYFQSDLEAMIQSGEVLRVV